MAIEVGDAYTETRDMRDNHTFWLIELVIINRSAVDVAIVGAIVGRTFVEGFNGE